MPKKPKQDPALLKRIRETHDYYVKEWTDPHKEGAIDVRFVAGDPWDEKDKASRDKEEQKRPALVFDEASQYINGFIGKARQQRRSVKVEVGDGDASAETAEQLQGRQYHIEHKSKAQSKTIQALLDAATRGYGFFGIGKRYSDSTGRDQEPYYRGFDNPDCVLMDPDCKEYDASDATGCFVDDKIPNSEFQRKYKKFKPKDLADGDAVTPIIVTEFWDVVTTVTDRFLWIDDGSADGIETLESELPGGKYTGKEEDIKDERDIETKTVTKYLCQMLEHVSEETSSYGVEILEIEEWDDDSIPIVPVYGQRFYVSTGDNGISKRVFLSLIRRARDPMGLMNLAASAAAERVAMMPKTRFMMAAGQEVGHEDEYKNVGTSPLGFLLYEPQTDAAPGVELPPPQPVQWEPQLAPALELIKLCQNSIRSAVGQLASPELQKNDSGIAIKRLNDTGDNASFHLIDNYAQSIERGGAICCRLIRKTHDRTGRMVSVRSNLDEEKVVRLNEPHQDKTGKVVHYDFTKGEYTYTISTGPSHDSQADAIKEWATTLAQTDPKVGVQLLDKLTEMQNFGPAAQPLIDRLKKIIGPIAQDDNTPVDPRAQQALGKAQQMIDLLTQALKEAQQKIETEQIKQDAETQRQKEKNQTAIRVAKIQALAKVAPAQIEAEDAAAAREAEALYDAMEQGADHAQEIHLKQMDQQHQQALQEGQQAHQAGMQDQQLSAQAEQAQNAAQEQPTA